ncbi:MAG: hypothetical protein QOF19_2051 [Alphaproteobacteria bacterium]|nr:hypothetical protein [Alphaproteobacteria bacterium]
MIIWIAQHHSGIILGYALFLLFMMERVSLAQRETSINTAIFFVVSLSTLIATRIPTIAINSPLNPDEAQMIANAMKFAIDPLPWRSVDTTSSGPLNSMILMWPLAFGEHVTFSTARLTAALLLMATSVFVYASLARSVGAIRVAALGLMILYLSGFSQPDYFHYSSELLPICLVSIGVFGAIQLLHGNITRPRLFLYGAVLGCVPFAKLQATPAAILLGLSLVAIVLMRPADLRTRIRDVSILTCGAAAPAAIILIPLTLAGNLGEFWTSYIGWALHFVEYRRSYNFAIEQIWMEPTFAAYLAASILLLVLGTATTVRRWSAREFASIGIALLLAAASVFIIVESGTIYLHYLLIFAAPLALLVGLAWPGRAVVAPAKLAGIWSLFAVAAVGAAALYSTLPPLVYISPLAFSKSLFEAGDLFSWLPNKSTGLLVWGWKPEWNVYSGLAPATRDTHNWNQITEAPDRDYFRKRFIGDFERSPPGVIIDGVAPGSFFYEDPNQYGIRTFPELNEKIRSGYGLISSASEDCPRTYLRNDLLASTHFAKIKKIYASAFYEPPGARFLPELVDDFKVYETCIDRWLLPDGQLGNITLELDSQRIVSKVHLLNTRNGNYWDRTTTSAKIELLDQGRLVFEKSVDVDRYPYWTTISIPNVSADTLRVSVTAFEWNGGGFNEIKVEAAN